MYVYANIVLLGFMVILNMFRYVMSQGKTLIASIAGHRLFLFGIEEGVEHFGKYVAWRYAVKQLHACAQLQHVDL